MKTVKFRIWNGMEMVYDITIGKFGTFYVNPEKGNGLNQEDTASLSCCITLANWNSAKRWKCAVGHCVKLLLTTVILDKRQNKILYLLFLC